MGGIGSRQLGSAPGISAVRYAEERNIMAASHTPYGHRVKGITLSSTAVDAGNTPTTSLRAGLPLALLDSTGEYVPWDPDAAHTGADYCRGLLLWNIDMLDVMGTVEDKPQALLLTHGPVLQDLVPDSLLTDTLRAQLKGKIIFTDDLEEDAGASNPYTRMQQLLGTTLVIADGVNNKMYRMTAAASTVKLPALVDGGGQFFRFLQIGATSLQITPKTGEEDTLIGLNEIAGADTATINTAGEILGAVIHAESVNISGTPMWLITSPNGATITFADV